MNLLLIICGIALKVLQGVSSEDICTLPIVTGPCTALFQRYAFNIDTLKCEEFTYGGCPGNDNRFDTFQDCEDACGQFSSCYLKIETGPCRAAIPRYAYNSTSQKCQKFTYGGCHGNDNNFEELKDCQKACVPCD